MFRRPPRILQAVSSRNTVQDDSFFPAVRVRDKVRGIFPPEVSARLHLRLTEADACCYGSRRATSLEVVVREARDRRLRLSAHCSVYIINIPSFHRTAMLRALYQMLRFGRREPMSSQTKEEKHEPQRHSDHRTHRGTNKIHLSLRIRLRLTSHERPLQFFTVWQC